MLSTDQVKVVQNHLNMVFKHEIDPSIPDPTGELQSLHQGSPFTQPNQLRC